jgi:hypothetical protein
MNNLVGLRLAAGFKLRSVQDGETREQGCSLAVARAGRAALADSGSTTKPRRLS